ncbi:MAG: hypothetical protein KDI82_17800, partial [Gammaproteobacteria bacterium]|nr:hypothetical protein [Gammaproteobacteria bacterium]
LTGLERDQMVTILKLLAHFCHDISPVRLRNAVTDSAGPLWHDQVFSDPGCDCGRHWADRGTFAT